MEMTLEEAEVLTKKLGDINYKMWHADRLSKKLLKKEFSDCVRSLAEGGWKPKSANNRERPEFHPSRIMSCVEVTWNRPDDAVKNDCTIRCISLCTGVDYHTLLQENLLRAERKSREFRRSIKFRMPVVWMDSLYSRGFVKVFLPRKVTRKVFVKRMACFTQLDDIIATYSCCHLAAIDMSKMKILDTWDSSGGRVEYVFVPSNKADVYQEAFIRAFAR